MVGGGGEGGEGGGGVGWGGVRKIQSKEYRLHNIITNHAVRISRSLGYVWLISEGTIHFSLYRF